MSGKMFGYESISGDDGLKCYGCGGKYDSVDCSCHKGMDIDLHRQNMKYWNNWSLDTTLENKAKGLIFLNIAAFALKDEKKLNIYWIKATEEEKAAARALWKSGFKPVSKDID